MTEAIVILDKAKYLKATIEILRSCKQNRSMTRKMNCRFASNARNDKNQINRHTNPQKYIKTSPNRFYPHGFCPNRFYKLHSRFCQNRFYKRHSGFYANRFRQKHNRFCKNHGKIYANGLPSSRFHKARLHWRKV